MEYKAYNEISNTTRLLIHLLFREQVFERCLLSHHVEDEYIYKRIRLVARDDLSKLTRAELVELEDAFMPELLKFLHRLQCELRAIYKFRLLRDWG